MNHSRNILWNHLGNQKNPEYILDDNPKTSSLMRYEIRTPNVSGLVYLLAGPRFRICGTTPGCGLVISYYGWILNYDGRGVQMFEFRIEFRIVRLLLQSHTCWPTSVIEYLLKLVSCWSSFVLTFHVAPKVDKIWRTYKTNEVCTMSRPCFWPIPLLLSLNTPNSQNKMFILSSRFRRDGHKRAQRMICTTPL